MSLTEFIKHVFICNRNMDMLVGLHIKLRTYQIIIGFESETKKNHNDVSDSINKS